MDARIAQGRCAIRLIPQGESSMTWSGPRPLRAFIAAVALLGSVAASAAEMILEEIVVTATRRAVSVPFRMGRMLVPSTSVPG